MADEKSPKEDIMDTFDGYMRKIIENINQDGKINIDMSKIIARFSYTSSTFYNYGGFDMIEVERSFVDYGKKKNGKIKVDVEEAREYYGV